MIPYHPLSTISFWGITFQVWGLFAAVGFLAGVTLYLRIAPKVERGSHELFILLTLLTGLIGARAGYIFSSDTSIGEAIFANDGLGFAGGLVAGALAAWGLIRLWRWPTFKVLDPLALSLALAYTIGRIGCFAIHDHIGKPTDVPWGIRINGQTFHETSLYTFLAGLLLFLTLLFLRKRLVPTGTLTALFFVQYALGRFIIEFFQVGPYYLGLTYTQFVMIPVFLVGIYLFFRLRILKSL